MTMLTQRLAASLERAARLLRRADKAGHQAGPHPKVLVLGGVRSGKSRHAERLMASHPEVVYVAPGPPAGDDDPEWAERVARHRARRPGNWRTLETTDLATTLRKASRPLLIDCLGTWVSQVLGEVGAWDQRNGWELRLDNRMEEFLAAFSEAHVPVVAVSNETGMGVVPATFSGRVFRDVLGTLNSRVGTLADSVQLVMAGRVVHLRERALQ